MLSLNKFLWYCGLEEGTKIIAWSTLLSLLLIFYVVLDLIVAALFLPPEQLEAELYGTIFESVTTTGRRGIFILISSEVINECKLKIQQNSSF